MYYYLISEFCSEACVLKAGIDFMSGDANGCLASLTRALEMRKEQLSKQQEEICPDEGVCTHHSFFSGVDSVLSECAESVKTASASSTVMPAKTNSFIAGKTAKASLDRGKITEFNYRNDIMECLVSYFSP